MKSQELNRQLQRLDWLIGQSSSFQGDQLEMQAHWARYLCVLVSGFIENAISDVYSQYSRSCASPNVSNYITSHLSKIQNPKSKKFLETAKSFNPIWEEDLGLFLAENGRKDAIDAIMSNRHLIAHGKDSGISLVRVKEYLEKVIQVIEFIEAQCGI